MRLEIIGRNVASAVPPPKVAAAEIAILTADQIGDVFAKLDGYGGRYGSLSLHAIAALAIGTGMRRGEICGLAWGAVDLDKARVRIDRSLEETVAGLRFITEPAHPEQEALRVFSMFCSTQRQSLEYFACPFYRPLRDVGPRIGRRDAIGCAIQNDRPARAAAPRQKHEVLRRTPSRVGTIA
jgi:Phage integrase family